MKINIDDIFDLLDDSNNIEIDELKEVLEEKEKVQKIQSDRYMSFTEFINEIFTAGKMSQKEEEIEDEDNYCDDCSCDCKDNDTDDRGINLYEVVLNIKVLGIDEACEYLIDVLEELSE